MIPDIQRSNRAYSIIPCATDALLLAFVVVKVHAVELEFYLVQEDLVREVDASGVGNLECGGR